MNEKKYLGVPSTIIVFSFISIFWYLVFNFLQLNDSYLSYLVWAAIGLSVVWFCQYTEYSYGRSFASFMGAIPKKSHIKDIVLLSIFSLMIGIGSVALLIFIEASIDANYAINKWNLITAEKFDEIEWIFPWIVISTLTGSVIVPITEELVVRGLILNRLNKRYGVTIAIILSSLIFALAHLNKSYIGSFIHGIILALVAIKFVSLYYPIILHSIYNAVMFLAQKYLGLLFVADIERINEIQYWLPELSCLLIGIIWSIYYFRDGVKPTVSAVVNK